LVDAYVRQLQRDIRNFSQLEEVESRKNPSISDLHATWVAQFSDAGPEWERVRLQLHDSAQPISVRSVNQSAGAASLDYKSHLPAGLRVIAVGGDSLSRGLTLEGLSTSYFYRNSQAYDTLLQMGRWFGFRDGYADLCRIWLTAEAVHWYSHIWSATEELRDDFKQMWRLGLTPKDFGLKVRAHPDSLMVTARNKMRTAQTIVREISLSGNGIETARLLSGDKQLRAYLLDNFQTHPRNYRFQSKALSKFLLKNDVRSLDLWDVAMPQGEGAPEEFAGLALKPAMRSVVVSTDESSILVSGARARVGSRGVDREGLSRTEVERINADHPGENVSDRLYRKVRTKPLLLLHVLRGTIGQGETKEPYRPAPLSPMTALGLSFPPFDDSGIAGKVEFKANTVEWRQQLFSFEESDDLMAEDNDVD
jgi:hypothetical protein